MKIKTYIIKIVLTFFLVLNVVLTFLVICSIAGNFIELYQFYATKQTLADIRTKWESIAGAQAEKYVYIRNWHEQDRMHFGELFHKRSSLQDAAYKEYLTLNARLAEIDKNAYHDPKGYTLYAPELTEAFCALLSAVNARELLLSDIAFGEVTDYDSYYSQDLYSSMIYAEGEKKETIQPTERFEAYDQKQIIDALNKLPLPDYYFYGLKIFFVNGHSNLRSGRASYSNIYNNNTFIVVYNSPNTEALIETLIHEIGHVVDHKIFYDYKKNDNGILIKQENKQAMLEYAKIYNKSEYYNEYDIRNKDEWAGSLIENFAEDFANIYAGAAKKTAWEGEHTSEVKAFIEEKIAKNDISKIPLAKSTKIISEENVSDIALRGTSACIFYTKDSTVNIKIEEMIVNGNKIEAVVFSDNYHKINSINDENQITLRFPKKGKYDIFIAANASDTSLGKILYYRLTVIYDP